MTRQPTCRRSVPDAPCIRTEGDLTCVIEQDALETCATRAAAAVDGVTVAERRVRAPRGRGVNVRLDGERVSARVEIACRYGVPMAAAGRAVQRQVHDALSTLTGLEVARVDVEVVAVTRP